MNRLLFILLLLIVAVLFALAVKAQPSPRSPYAVTLAWSPSAGTNVITNYAVWWGVATNTYTNSVSVGTFTNATVTNLSRGPIYYFAATATDTNKLTSDYSAWVSYGVPAPPNSPTSLTITQGP